jgi:DNA ligase-1
VTVAKPFRPMLAGKAPDDLSTLRFPLLASPKLDGIRCLVTKGGVAMSRNLKPIPNEYIRAWLAYMCEGFDGELIVGARTGNDVWNRTQSGVMREDGEPDVTFHVFDDFKAEGNFVWRQEVIRRRLKHNDPKASGICQVEQIEVLDIHQLMVLEEFYVSEGYEGLMIRDPLGPYKFGRSTTKEGYLLKLKRFEDHEALCIGMVEKFHNSNEATKDELGRTKRSSAKAGKVPTGMMGALKCEYNDGWGSPVPFEIGTGFTDAQRKSMWEHDDVEGLRVKFKCQGFTPEDKKPRFPVFLGFRDERDI